MATVVKNFNAKDVLILGIICTIYVFSKYGLVSYQEEVTNVEQYEIDKVSGQSNEWLPGMGRLEYFPSCAYNDTFYVATRSKEIIILSGTCNIEDQMQIGNWQLALLDGVLPVYTKITQ